MTPANTPTAASQLLDDFTLLVTHIISRGGRSFFDAARDENLTLTQTVALSILDGENSRAMTINELAAAMNMSVPSASRAVDALHRLGLVERREGEQDRRKKEVRITEEGRASLVRVWRARLSKIEEILGDTFTQHADAIRSALAPAFAAIASA